MRESCRKKLLEALSSPGDSLNCSFFSGSGLDIPGIIDLAETLPFMADKRLIAISDSGIFKSGSKAEALADYLKKPSADTVFVFDEAEVDKRGRMFRAVSKNGYAVEFKKLQEEKLLGWMASVFARRGRRIRTGTARLLIDRVGTDMYTLKNEMEKLCSYTEGKKTVDEEDIEAIGTVSPGDVLFQMIDAMAEGRKSQTMKLYYQLVENRESPIKILVMIERHFNILSGCADLSDRRADKGTIASRMGIHPYFVKKYVDMSKKFRTGQLRKIISECLSTEHDIKSGRISDRLGVELMIVKCSGGDYNT